MGNKNSIVVQLESGDRTHSVFPGGEIAGAFHANLTEGIKQLGPDGIYVELSGQEHAWWKTTTGSGDNRRTKTHRRTRAVAGLPIRIRLDQPHQIGSSLRGQFSFPFNLILPYNLPATFHHRYRNGAAQVRYKIHAQLHNKGMMKVNLRFNTEIFIASPMLPPPTLNVLSPLAVQLQGKKGVLTCCCIPRGDVSIAVAFPRMFFEKGETIVMNATVQNLSSVDVKVRLKLRRLVSVEHHTHTTKLVEIIGNIVPAGATAENYQLTLQVPDFNPQHTGFVGNLITCQYQLRVEMDIPWAPDLELYQSVWLYERGAISRAAQMQQQQQASSEMNMGAEAEQKMDLPVPAYDPPPAYAPPAYNDIPAPDYDDGEGVDESPHYEEPPPGWEPTVFEPVKYSANPQGQVMPPPTAPDYGPPPGGAPPVYT